MAALPRPHSETSSLFRPAVLLRLGLQHPHWGANPGSRCSAGCGPPLPGGRLQRTPQDTAPPQPWGPRTGHLCLHVSKQTPSTVQTPAALSQCCVPPPARRATGSYCYASLRDPGPRKPTTPVFLPQHLNLRPQVAWTSSETALNSHSLTLLGLTLQLPLAPAAPATPEAPDLLALAPGGPPAGSASLPPPSGPGPPLPGPSPPQC